MKQILIKGNQFMMGSPSPSDHPGDMEYPPSLVEVESFYMDETLVTNRDFSKFISETGYVTDAEKLGFSFVFHLLLTESEKKYSQQIKGYPWWYDVPGASWNHPEGRESGIENRGDHPVVHVTHNDALQYCSWAGKRLPTEMEWELAARSGHQNRNYPWGDTLLLNGEHQANLFQGKFPIENTVEDGYLGTSPVKSFEPNEFGLYDMIGNVWEWSSTRAGRSIEEMSSCCFCTKSINNELEILYSMRGGSFLCHESYCKRYKVFSRNKNTSQSSASNIGFRCVSNLRVVSK